MQVGTDAWCQIGEFCALRILDFRKVARIEVGSCWTQIMVPITHRVSGVQNGGDLFVFAVRAQFFFGFKVFGAAVAAAF